MKPKHWKILQNELYPNYLNDKVIISPEISSLHDLMQAEIMSHLAVIKEIGSHAQLEFEEEQTLIMIEDELKNLELRFELHEGDQITYLL